MGYGITVKTTDSAGGIQIEGSGDPWTVEGQPIVRLGDDVQPHGPGAHGGPIMAQGSSWMTIDGVPVCREGHLANCGHPTTGREWFTLPD